MHGAEFWSLTGPDLLLRLRSHRAKLEREWHLVAQQAYLTAGWSRTRKLRSFDMEWGRMTRRHVPASREVVEQAKRDSEELTRRMGDRYRMPTEADVERARRRRGN